ncbi:MAG: nitroreductase family protein, partial [Phycisphaerae bacterium]|nr:nitroreductase family protein [Phycisphaerae bacterium]
TAMGGHRNSVETDVSIAVDHLTLAAVAEGLGTCWIGAFKEQAVKELLDVPADVDVIALVPLGYPATEGLNFPLDKNRRKPHAEVFAENKYAWK